MKNDGLNERRTVADATLENEFTLTRRSFSVEWSERGGKQRSLMARFRTKEDLHRSLYLPADTYILMSKKSVVAFLLTTR